MWDVGMKVVCVDDGPCRITGKCLGLILDRIYVIESIQADKTNGKIGFKLEGVAADINKVYPPKRRGEPRIRVLGFDPDRFRKVLPDKPVGCSEEFKLLLNKSADRRLPVLAD